MTEQQAEQLADFQKSSVEKHMARIALALELIASQQEQQAALMASLSESARMLCDAVEQAAVWSTLDEEQ